MEIYIIGRQRTGTTVFRELLSENGAVDCNEVFHGDINSHKYRFYKYYLDKIKDNSSLILPSNKAFIYREFMKKIKDENNQKHLAIDVKYFAIYDLNDHGRLLEDRPYIVDHIENQMCVHIKRKNKLEVIVSEEISKKTKKWSLSKEDNDFKKNKKIKINTNTLISEIEKLDLLDTKMTFLLKDIKNHEELYYEDMFDNNGLFSKRTIGVAKRLLSTERDISNVPKNIKMNPEPLSQRVSNWNDVVNELSGTKFEWMLDTI